MFEKILDWRAWQHPARAAIWTDSGEIPYGVFAAHVARMTTALDLEALPPGVVLIGRVRSAMTWVLTLALERLGHATAVDFACADDVIDTLRPATVVTYDSALKSRFGERILHLSDAWLRQALSQPPSARRSVARADDVVRIILSSGTTGARKPVSITRRVIDARVGRPLRGNLGPEPKVLQVQGLDTANGLQHPLETWSNGGLMMFPDRLTGEVFRAHKPNVMAMSPIGLGNLLPAIKTAFSASDRVHIRVIGSAPPPTLIRAALACEGVDLSIAYGSTEGGSIAYGPAALAIDRPGAVGFPAPWVDLEIIDDEGRPAPPGQSGAIRFRGEGVVEGGRQEGWFYPNDIGHIAHDGVLVIDGRKDDVINVGGLKLSSTRIEETALACEGVKDVAATLFPMTNGRWTVFLAIVSPDGYSGDDVRLRVLNEHKIDIRLVDLAEIPRNAMGKIERNAVRQVVQARVLSKV
jgi:acyl-coenzyme A synthetase/AMP-(fatty) acid ligase